MRIAQPDLSPHGSQDITIEWHRHGFRSVDPGGLLRIDPPPCARAATAHAWLALYGEWRRTGAQVSAWDVTFVDQVLHTVDEWFSNADPPPGVSQIRSYARRRVREREAQTAGSRSRPLGPHVPGMRNPNAGTAGPGQSGSTIRSGSLRSDRPTSGS
jgi:hypothetical protein